jgi:hypothetical protein
MNYIVLNKCVHSHNITNNSNTWKETQRNALKLHYIAIILDFIPITEISLTVLFNNDSLEICLHTAFL